ncbi:acyl-CoA dehydrogenase family protein [Streptomyces fuscichromogenes]|uniref:Acyl-CoA dehydrogenase n=1 Tax=Streptomyces fuscichromogenes TaxID=1324013 RepID=A0A917UFB8_9ACTN|nr:acyl-CoA dehydrogenase family protein [Streptomyces fuscichromogenes]GGM88749.1 acyl-CoA dehydrogenase [Streptomyces fuscichromogenes]
MTDTGLRGAQRPSAPRGRRPQPSERSTPPAQTLASTPSATETDKAAFAERGQPSCCEEPDTLARLVEVLAEHADAADQAAAFPEESVDALRRAGYLGFLVPTEHGGMGRDLAGLVETAQALAGGCLSTAMIWVMHCQQVDVLVRHAGAHLLDRLLPRIARGELYLASVTTGPVTGGHLLTAAEPLRHVTGDVSEADGDLWLERTAPVVTGGGQAEGFLVTMRAAQDAGRHSVSLVYADRSALTVESTGRWNTLGMRGTDSGPLRLRGTVPADQVIGTPGGFRRVATDSMIPLAHLGWSACWLGAARGALRGLLGWLRESSAHDTSSPLVRERIARVRLELELVSAYLERMRERVDEVRAAGDSLDSPALQIQLNTLKLAASELSFSAVDRMVQLAGLWAGYSAESPLRLERALRDLRSAALNYANDRLLTANGSLALLDRKVGLL